MSLRVLLADESSTIKKVMQLALQDFNVEVKAVPVGLDVLEVTRAFKPDLIFADVLLSKRNGYEVSAELKSDHELKVIPIILMWSGFMELDETKAQFSKADRRLEKPFDADTLRNMVRELVPKTQGNVISQYLSFPNLPEITEPAPVIPPVIAQLPQMTTLPAEPVAPPVIMDLDEPEDFQNVPLPKLPDRAPPPASRSTFAQQMMDDKSEPADPWAQQDLGKFKISIAEEDLLPDYDYGGKDLTRSSIAISSGVDDISIEDFANSTRPRSIDTNANSALGAATPHNSNLISDKIVNSASNIGAVLPGTNLPSMTTISHERMEQILREQVREVLEGIAWKVLPDLAERIIKEEIQKLIKDSERI